MEDWGEEIFAEGVSVKWKNGEGGGGGEGVPHPQPALHQRSPRQASNHNPRWRHRKPGLLVPRQNNACTAG